MQYLHLPIQSLSKSSCFEQSLFSDGRGDCLSAIIRILLIECPECKQMTLASNPRIAWLLPVKGTLQASQYQFSGSAYIVNRQWHAQNLYTPLP